MTVHRIALRSGTAAEWWQANPVLALGEPGFEKDRNRLKIGNGWSTWRSLTYLGEPPAKRNMRQQPITPSERAIVMRKGGSDEWEQANPILADGEPGFDVDANRMKVGDGKRRWIDLPYV